MQRRTNRVSRGIGMLSASLLIPMLTSARVEAQYGGDPFDPYRAAYRSSSVPTFNRVGPQGSVRLAAPPGMGTVPGIGDPGATTYPYTEFGTEALGLGFESFEPVPLPSEYDTLRGIEELGLYDRSYRPNREADQLYLQWKDELKRLYEQALDEEDPRRKNELLRRYQEVRREVSLGLAPSASNRAMYDRDAIADRDADTEADERRPRAPSATRAERLPDSVRSYDELLRWSHVVNRNALRRATSREPTGSGDGARSPSR